jgi:hypothetical protein
MRVQKFKITGPGGETVGIKRDIVTYQTIIGGNGAFIDTMRTLITVGFSRNLPRANWITANKVRFRFLSKVSDWDVFREKLLESGFVMTQTNSLERIMR